MGSEDILSKFIQYVPSWINIPCYQVQEDLVHRSEVPYCVIQQVYSEALGQASEVIEYKASRTVKYSLQLDCYSYRVGVKHATSYLEDLVLIMNSRSTYYSLKKEGISLNRISSIGRVEFMDEESSRNILRATMDIDLYSIITINLPNLGYVDKIEGQVNII